MIGRDTVFEEEDVIGRVKVCVGWKLFTRGARGRLGLRKLGSRIPLNGLEIGLNLNWALATAIIAIAKMSKYFIFVIIVLQSARHNKYANKLKHVNLLIHNQTSNN